MIGILYNWDFRHKRVNQISTLILFLQESFVKLGNR